MNFRLAGSVPRHVLEALEQELKFAPEQARDFQRRMRIDALLDQAVEYVEMNPVKAGICERPELWTWGSAALRWAAGETPAVPEGTCSQ